MQLSIDREQARAVCMLASCTQGLSNTSNRRPIGHPLIARHAVEVPGMCAGDPVFGGKLPEPFSLPHLAEVLGGVSQSSQYGSHRPPTTQCIAHGLGQWLLLARPTASIGRENGQKMTVVAVMHGTQEPGKTRLCQVIQES
jgi:hypothetical protein